MCYLRSYLDSDRSIVLEHFESEKMLNKYLNKGIYSFLSKIGCFSNELYVMIDSCGKIVAEAVIRKKWRNYWIYGVKVRVEERGKGHGQLLTEKLLQIVCERNVKSVRLKVDAENRVALNLYKKSRFVIIRKDRNNNYIMEYRYA